MTDIEPSSEDVLVPVNLSWRNRRWRRYGLVYDRQARTVAWSARRGTQVFAVPGSPKCDSLPTLAAVVVAHVVLKGNGPIPAKLFVLVDDHGHALGRFTSTFINVFDQVWPAENLAVVRNWGVELREIHTNEGLAKLNERFPGVTTQARRRRT
jgi:hypothetical protein